MIKEPLIPIIALVFLLGIPLALLLLHILRRAEHPGMKIFSALRLVLIFGLVFAIACRFKTEEKLYNSEAKNVDVLFVVDGTISMWAKDGRNGSTRIDQVRSDCRMIMEELPGASYGLVRFNNTSMVMSPYTQDTEAVEDALDRFCILGIGGHDHGYRSGRGRPGPDLPSGQGLCQRQFPQYGLWGHGENA